MTEILDENKEPLNGDLIGVYQDVFLQMVEKEDTDLSIDDIENGNLKSDSKFVADRPFMVVLQIDNEVIAIGRVKDPLWCKTCENQPTEYIDITDQVTTSKIDKEKNAIHTENHHLNPTLNLNLTNLKSSLMDTLPPKDESKDKSKDESKDKSKDESRDESKTEATTTKDDDDETTMENSQTDKTGSSETAPENTKEKDKNSDLKSEEKDIKS